MFKSPKILFAAAAVMTAPALAVEPESIQLGSGVRVTPLLDVEVGYDDNIRGVGVNEESSWVTRISPSALLEAMSGLNLYQLRYQADINTYHSSQDDNHVNHNLEGLGTLVFDQRNRLNLKANYTETEQIANSRVLGINDQFNTTSVGAVYGFGVPAATINLDAGVEHTWRRTDNSAGINDDREYDNLALNGILYFRVSPKTRVLAEYRHEEREYELTGSPFDNDRNIALLGVTWDATAKTVGTIKAGHEKRDFDDASRKDISNSFWELDVTWQPRPLSTVTLGTSKESREGEFTAEYVKSTNYDIGWNQRWTDRVHSDVYYAFTEEDYVDQSRTDDINRAGVRLNYDLLRWATVGIGYTYYDRDSPLNVRDYDRNIYMLNFNVSL